MAFDPKIAVSNWNAALENLNAQINSDDPIEKRLDQINDIVNELANDRFDVNPKVHQKIVELQGDINHLAAQTSISKEQEADILSKLRNVYKIGKVAENRMPSKASPPQAPKKEDIVALPVTAQPKESAEVDINKVMEMAKKDEVDKKTDAVVALNEKALFKQILEKPLTGSYETQLKEVRLTLRQLLDIPSLKNDFPIIYQKILSIYDEVETALKADPAEYGPPPSMKSILQKVQNANRDYGNAMAVKARLDQIKAIEKVLDEVSTPDMIDRVIRDHLYSIKNNLNSLLLEPFDEAFRNEFPETRKQIVEFNACNNQKNYAEIRSKLNDIYKSYKTEQSPYLSENIKLWEYLFQQALERRPSDPYENQLKAIQLPLRQLLDFSSFRKDLPSIYENIQSISDEVESVLKGDPSQYGPPPSINSILQKIQKAYDEYNLLRETVVAKILPKDVLGIIAGQTIEDKGGQESIAQMDRLGFSTAFSGTANDARTAAEYLSKYPGLSHLDLNLLKRAGKELHTLYLHFTPSISDLEQIKQVCPNIRDIKLHIVDDLTDQILMNIAQKFPDLENISLPSDMSKISDEALKQFFSLCTNLKKVYISEMSPNILSLLAEIRPDLHQLGYYELTGFSDKTITDLLKFKFVNKINLKKGENISEEQLTRLFSQPYINVQYLDLGFKPSKEILSLIAKNCPYLRTILIIDQDIFNDIDQKAFDELLPLLPGLKHLLVLNKSVDVIYKKAFNAG